MNASANMRYLKLETRGDVALIGLNRPEKRNAISDAFIEEMDTAVTWAEQVAKAGVIYGHGPHFCAGAWASRTLIAEVAMPMIFDRLKGAGAESTIGLMVRGAIASALSQAVDSVIFITLAFYGLFPIMNLLIGQVIAKVVLSLVLVPFLITGGVKAARWLDGRGTMPA